MIHLLSLHRFKSFREATLQLGPLSVLIGANASGKSNLRDAFRFLHGIGLGYSLAEILGEKYVGGERVWSGIRGGMREVAYSGSDSFALRMGMELRIPPLRSPGPFRVQYFMEVKLGQHWDKPPRVLRESLIYQGIAIFRAENDMKTEKIKVHFIMPSRRPKKNFFSKNYNLSSPVIVQVAQDDEMKLREVRDCSRAVVQALESFRFLDLSPNQMRIPSLPGQAVLGDRGENLSSVLAAICEDASRKETLLEWVRKLTPMDVEEFQFVPDAAGRILVHLAERDGRVISAASASDGTLRFLGILAALFGPTPASFSFIEELENGIHPTRLSLLVDLIEHQVRRREIQVVATCHAPLVLQFLSENALADASIAYRLPHQPDTKVRRILEVPEASRVIREQSVALLHASSWFEDALNLTEDEAAALVSEDQPA